MNQINKDQVFYSVGALQSKVFMRFMKLKRIYDFP